MSDQEIKAKALEIAAIFAATHKDKETDIPGIEELAKQFELFISGKPSS